MICSCPCGRWWRKEILIKDDGSQLREYDFRRIPKSLDEFRKEAENTIKAIKEELEDEAKLLGAIIEDSKELPKEGCRWPKIH